MQNLALFKKLINYVRLNIILIIFVFTILYQQAALRSGCSNWRHVAFRPSIYNTKHNRTAERLSKSETRV